MLPQRFLGIDKQRNSVSLRISNRSIGIGGCGAVGVAG